MMNHAHFSDVTLAPLYKSASSTFNIIFVIGYTCLRCSIGYKRNENR